MRAASQEDIADLGGLPIDTLRDRFTELYGRLPPARLGKDLMIRAIAHRIQEHAEGGLRPTVQRHLSKLVRAFAETGQVRIDSEPAVKPGTRLIRAWQGQTHQVTVTADGYVYRDRSYRSLSMIAREITGTRWSGPRFFGLKRRNRAS